MKDWVILTLLKPRLKMSSVYIIYLCYFPEIDVLSYFYKTASVSKLWILEFLEGVVRDHSAEDFKMAWL